MTLVLWPRFCKIMDCLVSQNARDVGLIPDLSTIFPIFITLPGLNQGLVYSGGTGYSGTDPDWFIQEGVYLG